MFVYVLSFIMSGPTVACKCNQLLRVLSSIKLGDFSITLEILIRFRKNATTRKFVLKLAGYCLLNEILIESYISVDNIY